MTAAALFAMSTVLTQVAPVGTEYVTATDYLHQLIPMAAYAAVLVALKGDHARHRSVERYGRVGSVGAALTAGGYAAVLVIVAAGVVMGARVLNDVRPVAALVLLVGSVILGVAILRAQVVPWWCGALLIVAFPLGDVANEAFDGAEGLLLALLWGSIGLALLKPTRPSSETPAAPTRPSSSRT
jgi:hypothetical protein